MPKEITSNVELSKTAEETSLTLKRIRIENTTDKDSRIFGTDYPSGIIVSD